MDFFTVTFIGRIADRVFPIFPQKPSPLWLAEAQKRKMIALQNLVIVLRGKVAGKTLSILPQIGCWQAIGCVAQIDQQDVIATLL